jgi:hypothetical protein
MNRRTLALLAIAVSVLDRKGQARLVGVDVDFAYAGQRHE